MEGGITVITDMALRPSALISTLVSPSRPSRFAVLSACEIREVINSRYVFIDGCEEALSCLQVEPRLAEGSSVARFRDIRH